MKHRLWTISNVLSGLRVLLVVPIAAALMSNSPEGKFIASLLICIAVATDFLDGALARKLDQVSELGKIIDPLADKTGIAVVVTVLVLQEKIPPWFFLAVIVRDIAILAGGMYVRSKFNVTLQSTWTGKWAVGIMAAYIFFAVVDSETLGWLKSSLLIASSILLIVSFAVYMKRFLMMRGGRLTY